MTLSIPIKQLLLSLCTVCYFLYTLTSPAHATTEFSTSFDSTYSIASDNHTDITHKIKLTNQLSHIYPTEYTILVGSSNVSDITTLQDGSPTNHLITKSDTSITITLNQLSPVVGQGQTTQLEISYSTSDLIETFGRTRSINIPRLAKANEASSYTRTLIIPSDFGLPTIQYPTESKASKDGNNNTVLTYTGYPLSSLTLLFGDSEYYQLDLIYQIHNPTLTAIDTEIALPPDTAYQRSILDSLDPTPTNVYQDSDGNWLATYPLKSQQSLEISAKMFLEVFATPQTKQAIHDVDSYLEEQPYWDISNPTIQTLAQKLSIPQNIYEYVYSNLSYDYSKIDSTPQRQGAKQALSDKSGICTEYTDLFVTLARAAGIPAREINGYAYTNNTTLRPSSSAIDTIHAWPEYYSDSDESWIQLDPTWASTSGGVDYFHKLDFSHLTFVIHGRESSYPLPVGSYKQDSDLAAIKVQLVDSLPELTSSISRQDVPKGIQITNNGNTATLDSVAGYLPPLGHTIISPAKTISNNTIDLVPKLVPYLIFGTIIIAVFMILHHFKKRL